MRTLMHTKSGKVESGKKGGERTKGHVHAYHDSHIQSSFPALPRPPFCLPIADSFPQLYRTWDAFEVIENLGGDGELCLVAEELLESDSNGTAAAAGAAGAAAAAVAGNADDGDDTAPALAHPQSQIVGFIFGSITEKRKREHSCGLLGWVGVAPSHQRRNIGTVLAHKLFEQFLEDGISLIVADTPMENTPAIQFLHRMGFATPVYHVSHRVRMCLLGCVVGFSLGCVRDDGLHCLFT